MDEKFISRKKENLAKRCLKGIGYWFLGNFMCFFICSTMVVLMRGTIILKVFVSLCTLLITMGLYFNWMYYAAKRDRNAVKFHNTEYDRFMPLKMSIAGPIVPYITLIMLYLSKLGVIKDIFSYFLFSNMWTLPFVTMFTGERTIDSISWWGILGLTFLLLIQPAVISATYILTYRDVDVVKIVFYKK